MRIRPGEPDDLPALERFLSRWNALVVARKGVLERSLEHPRLGAVDQIGSPFTLSGGSAAIRTPPPLPGEHADEILDELGFAPDEIAQFRTAGVV